MTPSWATAATRSAQWRAMFAARGLEATVIDSGLPSYKPSFRRRAALEPNLTHFLLRI